ncbi:MAG TPA: hypothetical protein VGB69_02410 [Edaphobacter sp.]
MEVSKIIAEIDAQIFKLQQARALLADASQPVRTGRGRPKGSKNTVTATPSKRKRNLTPEGRKRIADAMKRRWAERRKQTSSKATKSAASKSAAAKTK